MMMYVCTGLPIRDFRFWHVCLSVDSLLLLLLLSLLLTLRRRRGSHLGLMCTRSRNEGCNRGL